MYIGAKTNIQDRAVVSVTNTSAAGPGSTYIGNQVTVGTSLRTVSLSEPVFRSPRVLALTTRTPPLPLTTLPRRTGHGAILHACTVEDEAVIGMGAVIMDGAVVEKGAYVAPGAVVAPETVVGEGEVYAGNPAVLVRKLDATELAANVAACNQYWTIAQQHEEEFLPFGTNYQAAEQAGL